jgi:hypothetical protein
MLVLPHGNEGRTNCPTERTDFSRKSVKMLNYHFCRPFWTLRFGKCSPFLPRSGRGHNNWPIPVPYHPLSTWYPAQTRTYSAASSCLLNSPSTVGPSYVPFERKQSADEATGRRGGSS